MHLNHPLYSQNQNVLNFLFLRPAASFHLSGFLGKLTCQLAGERLFCCMFWALGLPVSAERTAAAAGSVYVVGWLRRCLSVPRMVVVPQRVRSVTELISRIVE